MVISESMILSTWNGAASSATVTVNHCDFKPIKLWDFDNETMPLSELKQRARLFRAGINN